MTLQGVTQDLAQSFGLEKAQGALVAEVTPDSPAAKAGLKRGDVIRAVDGQTVKGPRDLTRLIATATPGSKVELELLRAGKPTERTVTLGNRAEQPA
ncbi:MAG: hypothetical protein KatS3mg118_3225 [Paracoccaceae bacterium]|nr:MAG: hypothetical protein KatS3mg118_3225 [Paracoccaceae bacterium]